MDEINSNKNPYHLSKKEIRALFIINTPAQAYTWRSTIKELIQHHHRVQILARNYGQTIDILRLEGFQIKTFNPYTNRNFRIFEIINHLSNGYKVSRWYHPSIIIGFGVDATLLAFIMRRPSIIFTDSEGMPFQNRLIKIFSQVIITPDCFKLNFGKKQIRIPGYKELAYLHPNYFTPDLSIFNELGLETNEKYVILRFNAFDAFHDVSKHGFTQADQIELVKNLGKYVRVFISPEGYLSKELEKYKFPISYSRIHQALYFAQLLVTDTQTMATEAAILGTPVVRSNSFVGPNDMGIFQELEQKYDLIYSFKDPEQAIQKAIELLKLPDLKEQWAKKRQILLNDKIDVKQFMVNFIDNYPQSLIEYQRKRGLF